MEPAFIRMPLDREIDGIGPSLTPKTGPLRLRSLFSDLKKAGKDGACSEIAEKHCEIVG
jgi:hypothetical protein